MTLQPQADSSAERGTRLRKTVAKLGDRADEAIASSRERLDPASPPGGPSQHASDRRDLNRKVALLDHDPGPGSIDDAALGDVLMRSLDECAQDGNPARAERDRSARMREHPASASSRNGPIS